MRWSLVLYDFKKVGKLTKKWSNLPDSYIKRAMEQVVYRTPRGPEYQRRADKQSIIKFTQNRPWTLESRTENPLIKPNRRRPFYTYVEPLKEWIIFRGDRVEILDGKDKGKQGVVNNVIQERNWVTVEHLNLKISVKKRVNGSPTIVFRTEEPLRVTDQVSLIDPSDMLPCKVEWRYTEKGEKVRVSLRSGRVIPIPKAAQETYDYKIPLAYEEKDKDTTADVVKKVTFQPKLCTFEMEIMEKQGIKDDRQMAPFYWY